MPLRRRKRRNQSRLRRWTKRVFVTLAVLVVLFAAGLLGVLNNLEAPVVKTRLVALVHDKAGLDIDYRHTSFDFWHGLALTDVTVQQPVAMRTIAPHLAKVGLVSVGWNYREIQRVGLSDVALTIAIDEQGRTSFDELGGPPDPKAEPTPLSQRGRDIGSIAAKLPEIVIDRARVMVARSKDTTALDGVAVRLSPVKEHGKWHTKLLLGSPSEPLALTLTHGTSEAHARLALEADATESDVSAALDLTGESQTFASEVDISRGVHASATAHFDPAAKTTRVGVERLLVGEGVADVNAALDIPDIGAPRINHAHGAIDFVRLLAMLPEGLLPVHIQVGEGRADFDIADLALDKLPKLSEGAKVAVEAKLASLEVEEIRAKSANVSVHVTPTSDDGLHATAKVDIDDGRRDDVRGQNLVVDLDATQNKAGKLNGKANVGFDSLTAAGVGLKQGKIGIDTKEFDPDTLKGELSLTTDVEKLRGNGVEVPVHATAHVTDLDAKAGTGTTVVDLDAKESHVHLVATRSAAAIDYVLDGSLPALDPIRQFLPAGLSFRGAKVTSRGHVDLEKSAARSIQHHTEIKADAAAYSPYLSTGVIGLTVDSHGDAEHHAAKGVATVAQLHIAGADTADEHVAFDVSLDRPAQKLELKLEATGHAKTRLDAKLALTRGNAVKYDLDLDVAKLGPLASYIGGGLDLAKLDVSVKGKGLLTGVVGSRAPLTTAAVDGNLDVRARNVEMNGPDLALSVPEATIASVLGRDGDKRTVKSTVHAEKAKISNRMHSFSVAELTDEITAGITGDLAQPEISSSQKLAIQDLEQDLLPMYVIGDAKVDIVARRSTDGVIHVADLNVVNGKGGTVVALKGAIDPNEPQRLSLKGTVKQELSKLSHAPELFTAKGTANVTLDVESPDLTVFRTNADVAFQNTDIHIPSEKIHVEGANGQVPITASIRIDKYGATLLRENDNPYAALRFADQHPLLNRQSFLNVKKLTLPQNGREGVIVVAPLVGNFQVVHNIFTLRQFEMGFRGGRVTGQAALDWNREKSVVDLRVRADHIQSSTGEPFTGSASVIISAADHNIEGRADILQIGERHLRDILDLEDPFRTDPSINSVRSALKFGYPDKIRIGFKRGFASAHIELGGLAWLFRIDDLKGLPIGPVIDRYLGPIFPVKTESRMEAQR